MRSSLSISHQNEPSFRLRPNNPACILYCSRIFRTQSRQLTTSGIDYIYTFGWFYMRHRELTLQKLHLDDQLLIQHRFSARSTTAVLALIDAHGPPDSHLAKQTLSQATLCFWTNIADNPLASTLSDITTCATDCCAVVQYLRAQQYTTWLYIYIYMLALSSARRIITNIIIMIRLRIENQAFKHGA